MTTNRSHAVAEQNRAAGDRQCDWPTPPWCTRALFEHVILPRLSSQARAMLKFRAAWEPTCNRGHMSKPLAEYLGPVLSTDLYDYGWEGQQARCDFLPVMGAEDLPPQLRSFRGKLYRGDRPIDWIVANPPFAMWDEFAQRCLDLDPLTGFALFGRLGALSGRGRYREIYAKRPPSIVAVFTERCSLVPGGLDPDAEQPHLYAWYVWLNGFHTSSAFKGERATSGAALSWIPECRDRLERPQDYVDAAPVRPAEGGDA
jgi:hypothetical protein